MTPAETELWRVLSDYNGWKNWETLTAHGFANGECDTDRDDEWAEQVETAAAVGPSGLKALYVEVMGYALNAMKAGGAPESARLYFSDLITAELERVDWAELAAHHIENEPVN
jgi:hypothetical protein